MEKIKSQREKIKFLRVSRGFTLIGEVVTSL